MNEEHGIHPLLLPENETVPQALWDKIVEEAKLITADAKSKGIKLAFECDQPRKKIILNKDEIRFNGVGDEGHETFLVTRNPHHHARERVITAPGEPEDGRVFWFCKTARKPYDAVVTSLMKVMKDVAKDYFLISSDGGPKAFKRTLGLTENAGSGNTAGDPVEAAAGVQ